MIIAHEDHVIRLRAILAGLAVWALATLAFRLVGQWLLLPGWGGVAIFAAVGLAMALLGPALRPGIGAARLQADRAAVALTAPGLLLDAGVTAAFDRILPNVDPGRAGQFGALMLWGYGVAALAISIDAARRAPMARPLDEEWEG